MIISNYLVSETKRCVDDYIRNDLKQRNSECSVAWIIEELVRQKDFSRESGTSMTDHDISAHVCEMAKTSILTQYNDELKYQNEMSLDRPNEESKDDGFIPPFGDPISKHGMPADSLKRRNLETKRGQFNVDSFVTTEGSKPYYITNR